MTGVAAVEQLARTRSVAIGFDAVAVATAASLAALVCIQVLQQMVCVQGGIQASDFRKKSYRRQ